MRVDRDNILTDVRWGGPADTAKLAPGDKLIAINGRVATSDGVLAAVREAKGSTTPIHLIVQNESYIRTVDVDYHDGEKYPALQRIDGTPAYLDDITTPLSPQTKLPTLEPAGGDADGAPRGGRRRPQQ